MGFYRATWSRLRSKNVPLPPQLRKKRRIHSVWQCPMYWAIFGKSSSDDMCPQVLPIRRKKFTKSSKLPSRIPRQVCRRKRRHRLSWRACRNHSRIWPRARSIWTRNWESPKRRRKQKSQKKVSPTYPLLLTRALLRIQMIRFMD